MAIQFTEEKKKQKYLIGIFAIVLVITAGVVYFGFMGGADKLKRPLTETNIVPPRKVKIDFVFLGGEMIEALQLFEKILPFEDSVGRENPFIPYGPGNTLKTILEDSEEETEEESVEESETEELSTGTEETGAEEFGF